MRCRHLLLRRRCRRLRHLPPRLLQPRHHRHRPLHDLHTLLVSATLPCPALAWVPCPALPRLAALRMPSKRSAPSLSLTSPNPGCVCAGLAPTPSPALGLARAAPAAPTPASAPANASPALPAPTTARTPRAPARPPPQAPLHPAWATCEYSPWQHARQPLLGRLGCARLYCTQHSPQHCASALDPEPWAKHHASHLCLPRPAAQCPHQVPRRHLHQRQRQGRLHKVSAAALVAMCAREGGRHTLGAGGGLAAAIETCADDHGCLPAP